MSNFGGERPYVAKNIQVASFTSEGSYGTAVAVGDRGNVTITPVYDNDMIQSAGMNVRALSVARGFELSFQAPGFEFDVIAAMTGLSTTSSGSTPNQQETLTISGAVKFGYFGMTCRLLAEDGGDLQLGFYKCMLRNLPELQVNQNEFAIPELEADVVALSTDVLMVYKQLETGAAITLSDFLS